MIDSQQPANNVTRQNNLPATALVWGLRLLGGLDLLALVAVVMPLSWMSRINDYCGLGPLPDSPIVGYLARTSSGMYALHGTVLMFVSTDIHRYRQFIKFLAITLLLYGPILLGIDLSIGMPLLWTLSEGPTCSGTGLLILWLQRQSMQHSDP